jgi:hypothetical protein
MPQPYKKTKNNIVLFKDIKKSPFYEYKCLGRLGDGNVVYEETFLEEKYQQDLEYRKRRQEIIDNKRPDIVQKINLNETFNLQHEYKKQESYKITIDNNNKKVLVEGDCGYKKYFEFEHYLNRARIEVDNLILSETDVEGNVHERWYSITGNILMMERVTPSPDQLLYNSDSGEQGKVVFDSLRRVRIEDVTDIEQTFSVILTSTPVLWDGTNNFNNTIPASLSGGTWPNIDANTDIWDRPGDQYSADKIYIQPVVKIENQPYLNFDISYPMLLERFESTLTFKLKRNRKYRFDLSHPSLSVNEAEPFPVLPLFESYIDYNTFEQTLSVNEEESSILNSSPCISEFRAFENVSKFEYYQQPGTNGKIMVDNRNKKYGIEDLDQFSITEGISSYGKPGTPGAYLDIVTHDRLPSSLTIFNSALPNFFSFSKSVSSYGHIFRDLLWFNANDDDYENNYDKYVADVLRQQAISQAGINTGWLVGNEYYRNNPTSNAFVLDLYYDNSDDFVVNGVQPLVTDQQPYPHQWEGNFINVENAFDNFDINPKWLDTRTRTVTAFVEKVMKKVKPNNPKNLVPAFSSLDINFGEFREPKDYYAYQRHNSSKGKFLFHEDNTKLMTDYFNPITRDGGNLSAWNPNWWGYEARDVLDFSGVAMDYDGLPHAAQGILVTPKHLFFNSLHWGSWAKKGHKVYFLERVSGKRVSATVIQVVHLQGSYTPNNLPEGSIRLQDLSGFNDGTYDNINRGDFSILKLDRDVTQPDPNVPGSDGSVKVYKLPRWDEPFIYDWWPDDHKYNLDTRYQGYTSYGDNYFRALGSDVVMGVPMVRQFGIGAFGRTGWYDKGDEHVEMDLGVISNVVYRNNSLYPSVTAPGSVGLIGGDGGGWMHSSSDFNSLHLLSSNPFLYNEGGDETKPRLRLNSPDDAIAGDSSNPSFILAETKDHELQMLGPVNMTTASRLNVYGKQHVYTFPEGHSMAGQIASPHHLVSAVFDVMSGGNPEGYEVEVVDLT